MCLPKTGTQHNHIRHRHPLRPCTTAAAVAVLFVAVVGLAAGTGVEANRAKVAEASVRSMMMSTGALTTVTVAAKTITATADSATSTSFAALDDNCSGDPEGVSGTTYSAFSVIEGDRSFTIQCNADAGGNPLLKIFTSDIQTCMDACAAWSQDLPASFGSNSNTTCGAISFIPAWTNKTTALAGTAPGNCYLKPIQTAAPSTPNIGTPVHAGILISE
ncbi:unnamed protein product [Discula destructiva]